MGPCAGHDVGLRPRRQNYAAYLMLVVVLLLLLPPSALPNGGSSSGSQGRPRLRREPPATTTSSALWPDSASSGKPLPRAKPILNPDDSSWGSVWVPLDAVFDAQSMEDAGMRVTFNSVHTARVGMRVRVVGREELQKYWQNYNGRSVLQHGELTNLDSQADRVGAIVELDDDDDTAKIKLEPAVKLEF